MIKATKEMRDEYFSHRKIEFVWDADQPDSILVKIRSTIHDSVVEVKLSMQEFQETALFFQALT